MAERSVPKRTLEPVLPVLEGHTRAWPTAYVKRLVAIDIVVALLAAGIATAAGPWEATRDRYALISLTAPILWPLAVLLTRGYERRFMAVGVEEYRSVGRGALMLLASAAIFAAMVNSLPSRAYLLLFFPLAYVGSVLGRMGLRRYVRRQRLAGRLMQRTVVVGRADAVESLVKSLKNHPEQGFEPVAACAAGMGIPWEGASFIGGVPVLGGPEDAVAAVDLCDADVVVVTSHPELAGFALRRLSWALEDRNVELLVSTGLVEVSRPRLSIRSAVDTSLLHVERPAASYFHVAYKEIFDRGLALLMLLLLGPLFVIIAAAVKLSSPGSVFYTQARIGLRGEPFLIFKFRTMTVGADARLTELLHQSDGNAVQFKMRNDPRVTAIGKILRRYSLDELPQLFNVVLGTMSLVGPRPQCQYEVDQYGPDTMRRLWVRPGMTGLWQISGRSDLSWDESQTLDLRYVDNWSPAVDLRILLRTIQAVMRSSGAY